MKKRILSTLLTLMLCLTLLPTLVLAATKAADITVEIDTGENITLQDVDSDGYYEIDTADKLYAFAAYVNQTRNTRNDINAKLTDNITVNSGKFDENGGYTENGESATPRTWIPIGNALTYYFKGTFDGNRKTISGLYYSGSEDYVGLFGYVQSATVQDITVENSYFSGGENVGLLGYVQSATVNNVTVKNSRFCGSENVGGIVGYYGRLGEMVEITNCHNVDCYVSGTTNAGGIAGEFSNSSTSSVSPATITGCTNSGTVSVVGSNGSNVGGIVGSSRASGSVGVTITNCSNAGAVDVSANGGVATSGGIMGYGSVSNSASGSVGITITNCSSTGTVSSSSSGYACAGGITGFSTLVTIQNCYNTNTVSASSPSNIGSAYAGGVVGMNAGTIQNCYNTNTVSANSQYSPNAYAGGVVGVDSEGTVTNCCYRSDRAENWVGGSLLLDESITADKTEGKTAGQFASGEVCYFLNGNRSMGTTENPLVWYQALGEDDIPVLDSTHGTVYTASADNHYNNQSTDGAPVHIYDKTTYQCLVVACEEMDPNAPKDTRVTYTDASGVTQKRGEYISFNAAYEAAQSGDTIQLLADTGMTGENPTITKKITLDLNGKIFRSPDYRLTIKGEVTIKGTSGTFGALDVDRDGKVTLAGGIKFLDVRANEYGELSVENADVTELQVYYHSTVQLSGGTFDMIIRQNQSSNLPNPAQAPTFGEMLAEGYGFYRTVNGAKTWIAPGDNETILKNVTVGKIPDFTVTASADSTAAEGQDYPSYTYGDTITLTATDVAGASYQWYTVSGTTETAIDGKTSATYSPDGLDVGTYQYRVKVTVDGYTKSADVTVMVDKMASSLESSPTAVSGTLIYNAQEQALVSAPNAAVLTDKNWTLQYRLGEGGQWTTTIPTAKNAGDYTVYWYVDDNNSNYSCTGGGSADYPKTISARIEQRDIDGAKTQTPLVFANYSALTYNGQAQTPDYTLRLQTRETQQTLETLVKDQDYTVTVTPQTNAGENYSITFTGKGNYTGTDTRTWSIGTAELDASSTDLTGTLKVKNDWAKTYTFDFSALLPALGEGKSYGTVTYELTSVDGNIKYYENNTATFDTTTGALTLPIKSAYDGSTSSPVVTVVVAATTTNYGDIDLHLNVYPEAKTSKTLPVTMEGWTYGDTPNAPQYTLPTDVEYRELEIVYKNESEPIGSDAPTKAGDYFVVVGFETETESWSGQASFTVAKRPVTIGPKSYTITRGDAIPAFELAWSDTVLAGDSLALNCEAELDCYEANGTTAVSTSTAAGSYNILWKNAESANLTGDDAANYDLIKSPTGMLTINAKPGSSSTSTTTVKNPDGSITTTTTNKKTGEVTETTKNPNGVSGTTVTDKNGNVKDISANIPSSAVKDGETIKLPIDAVKPGDGTEIKVDVPNGGATIEIPVENPTADTVVVIVNKDGTETVIPGSKVTENGIEVTLTEDATIKVVDNSPTFSDVKPNDYYADAVAWAFSRDITDGVGGGQFGPDQSCTRAQIVTFLWRAAGCPAATSVSSFTDVSVDAYYAKAVAWAVENGITGGIGDNQFAPDQTCTRAQAVTFLFRYAAMNGMDTATIQELVSGYGDAAQVPAYALSAFNWALAQGVVNGTDGKLMPNDDCTRAQIVTMLYRLLGE